MEMGDQPWDLPQGHTHISHIQMCTHTARGHTHIYVPTHTPTISSILSNGRGSVKGNFIYRPFVWDCMVYSGYTGIWGRKEGGTEMDLQHAVGPLLLEALEEGPHQVVHIEELELCLY